MKKTNRIISSILSLSLFGISLVGCKPTKPEKIEVTNIKLDINEKDLVVGDTFQLTPTITPSDASEYTIEWISTQSKVATVSDSGLVTALNEGSTIIYASVNGCVDRCNVTVEKAPININRVYFVTDNIELSIGGSYTLEAKTEPEIEGTTFTYSVDSSGILTLDGNVITAVSAGNASVTATCDQDSSKTAILNVTVIDPDAPIAVKSVSLNHETLNLSIGEESRLIATINPTNATNTNVTWSSGNEEVVSVNEKGHLIANAEGSATVTVTTVDGEKSATCLVTVIDSTIRVTGISLNYDQLELEVGKTAVLSYNIQPYNATNDNVSWSISDDTVASLENGLLTALKEGTATITATTEEGNYKATISLTVKAKEGGTGYVVNEADEDILVIKEAGEYTLERDYKQIYVNAPDAVVVINMNGKTVENNENSPIFVEDCDTLEISATKNKTSYIKDTRSMLTEEVSSQGKGAIYVANGDLKLKATGTLCVSSTYYNGIHGKDDVKIQKLTLNIEAVNHGIKGNDSVEIVSGTINILCGGDGIKTENSDISSKGKQRGNITISGGTITINSFKDAITASHDVIIEETDASVPVNLTIRTNKYSSYNGEVAVTNEDKVYVRMNSNSYSNGNYKFAAYINGEFIELEYEGTQSVESGRMGKSTYYVYSFDKPSNANSFTLYRFSKTVEEFTTNNYNAYSEAKSFNSNYDMIQISIQSSRITFSSWSHYNSKFDYSCKGLKAENEITISSGTIDIKSYDDAIHANNDGTLENGNTPLGNVNISGGTLTLVSTDDGIHADYTVNISGGTINISEVYEGIEGNIIKISGGTTYVVATDDGVNATSGKSSPQIIVSGGYLDVTVPTNGDTDGIDSNGTYTQSGGIVIVKGPGRASQQSMGAAALDTDGSVTLSGGTLIIFGGYEKTPSASSMTKTLCSSSTVSAGTHTISFAGSDTVVETTLKYSTSGCVVFSKLGSATLR